MTTVLYVLGCFLVGGGTVVFFLVAPAGDEPIFDIRFAARSAPSAGTGTPGHSPPRRPDAEVDPVGGFGVSDGVVSDFVLWERELLGSRRVGCEQDQRARRELSRWERESRRRRRRERGW